MNDKTIIAAQKDKIEHLEQERDFWKGLLEKVVRMAEPRLRKRVVDFDVSYLHKSDFTDPEWAALVSMAEGKND